VKYPRDDITHYHETDEYICSQIQERTRRPLIVVEDGVSKLTENISKKLEKVNGLDNLINRE